jgi:hypothetical protein
MSKDDGAAKSSTSAELRARAGRYRRMARTTLDQRLVDAFDGSPHDDGTSYSLGPLALNDRPRCSCSVRPLRRSPLQVSVDTTTREALVLVRPQPARLRYISTNLEYEVLPDKAEDAGQQPSLTPIMEAARGHAEIGDTRQWIDNLERVIEVAWELMTPEQRRVFFEHADVVAMVEATGKE